jgi:hypothetical protein
MICVRVSSFCVGIGSFIVAIASFATVARADEAELEQKPPAPASTTPETLQNVTWALGGRVSYLSAPIRGGTTPFGAGFGGAFSFAVSNVYVGATLAYFLGGSDVNITDHALTYGLELGYEIGLVPLGRGRLVLRPQLGAGGATVYHTDPSLAKTDVVTSASGRSSSSTTSDTTSVNAFYVEPGATLLVAWPSFFAGVNANTTYLPSVSYGGGASATWVSYGLRAEAGALF